MRAEKKPPVNEQKQKLTLGISKDVIEKAKAENINISAITEQLLKAITYDPKGNTREDVAKAYEVFFQAIRKILHRYSANVEVGEHAIIDSSGSLERFVPIMLNRDELYVDLEGEYPRVSISDQVEYFYSPKQILENLIPALVKAAQRNKERLKEFEMAQKFLQVLPDNEAPRR